MANNMESILHPSNLPSLPRPPPPVIIINVPHPPRHQRTWDDDKSPTTRAPSAKGSYADINTKEFDVEEAVKQVMTEQEANARPKCFKSAFAEWTFVFTVMLASSSTTFLQGVILINTAGIGDSLHMTESQITWIAAAIGLASGSFMLFFGKTADLLGRKIQLILGMFALSLFSLLAAVSPSAIVMNILCGFLGLGTAAIAPPAIGLLFATYPEGKRRNMVTGALGCGNPLGFVLGSVSSGLATKYRGWRASFIVVAIFFLIMTIFAAWSMPTIKRPGSIRKAIRQFDYLGAFLTILGMALISAGLTEGPQHDWSAKIVTMIIIGVLCVLGFVAWEYFYEHPLLNLSVWNNRNFTLCIICTGFGYMSFITNEFWIALYMQDVQHYTPLVIAARMLPQALAGVVWSFLGQHLVERVHGSIIMGIGSISYLVGAILLLFIEPHTSYWKFLFPALCITVIGADFQFIVANLFINKSLPPQQASLGAGIVQTAYRLSISIGLSITAAISGSVSATLPGIRDPTLPYQRVYIAGIIFAAISLIIIPFMHINTRDSSRSSRRSRPNSNEDVVLGETFQRVKDESSGWESTGTRLEGNMFENEDGRWVLTSGGGGGANIFSGIDLPRWSWEPKDKTGGGRFSKRVTTCGTQGCGEMCPKCVAETKVAPPARVRGVTLRGGPGWGVAMRGNGMGIDGMTLSGMRRSTTM